MEVIYEVLRKVRNNGCFCVCIHNRNLVIVPCEDEMSGYYPLYKNEIILAGDCEEYPNRVFDGIDGLLQDDIGRVMFVEETWDGFQPIVPDMSQTIDYYNWLIDTLKGVE